MYDNYRSTTVLPHVQTCTMQALPLFSVKSWEWAWRRGQSLLQRVQTVLKDSVTNLYTGLSLQTLDMLAYSTQNQSTLPQVHALIVPNSSPPFRPCLAISGTPPDRFR